MKTSKTPFVCGESNIPKVLVLDRLIGGILAGQTVDAKGLPLKCPRVRVYLEGEINPRYEAEGDDEGQFRIEGISPGTYKIGIAIVGLGEKTYSDVGIVAPFTTELGVMVWI
jgi:hypothetical protein